MLGRLLKTSSCPGLKFSGLVITILQSLILLWCFNINLLQYITRMFLTVIRKIKAKTIALSTMIPQQSVQVNLSLQAFPSILLFDGWFNQYNNHSVCIISAFTAYFFLYCWHVYLLVQQVDSPGLMSTKSNGIFQQSPRILMQLFETLLDLIILHQENSTSFPLSPWKHGTEASMYFHGCK